MNYTINFNKRFKRIGIYILIVVSTSWLTGCYSTEMVTSKARLDNCISSTEMTLNELGYQKNGSSTNKNTDVTRSEGLAYFPNVGFVPYYDEEKTETTVDNYTFADSKGNTVSYSVSYELKDARDNILYVENTHIVGCATNNPNEYELLCGTNSPINKINKIEKTDSVYIYSKGKTIWFVIAITIATLALLALIGLAME